MGAGGRRPAAAIVIISESNPKGARVVSRPEDRASGRNGRREADSEQRGRKDPGMETWRCSQRVSRRVEVPGIPK